MNLKHYAAMNRERIGDPLHRFTACVPLSVYKRVEDLAVRQSLSVAALVRALLNRELEGEDTK